MARFWALLAAVTFYADTMGLENPFTTAMASALLTRYRYLQPCADAQCYYSKAQSETPLKQVAPI